MGGAWVFPGGAVDARRRRRRARRSRAAAVREVAGGGGRRARLTRRARALLALDHPGARCRSASTPGSSSPPRPTDAEPEVDGERVRRLALVRRRAAALDAYEAGELTLVFPTIKHLEQLAAFDTADALLDLRRASSEVRPVEPRVIVEGEVARILLPGEPGYDEAGGRTGVGSGRRACTVAVTGPTGEIGARVRARARALAATSSAIVGMARRPFDPAAARLEARPSTATATCSTARRSTALVAGADVVVHLAFIIMGAARRDAATINLEGSRNVFEAAVAARRPAPRLRVVGRRLRLPRRQPGAADRGRPGARHRRPLLLRARRPSVEEVLLPTLLDERRHRRLRLPALHRRRARRADADRQDPLRPARRAHARRGARGCSTRCRCSSR